MIVIKSWLIEVIQLTRVWLSNWREKALVNIVQYAFSKDENRMCTICVMFHEELCQCGVCDCEWQRSVTSLAISEVDIWSWPGFPPIIRIPNWPAHKTKTSKNNWKYKKSQTYWYEKSSNPTIGKAFWLCSFKGGQLNRQQCLSYPYVLSKWLGCNFVSMV